MQQMKNLTPIYLLRVLLPQNFSMNQRQDKNGHIQIAIPLSTKNHIKLLRTLTQLLSDRIQPISGFDSIGHKGHQYFSEFAGQSAHSDE